MNWTNDKIQLFKELCEIYVDIEWISYRMDLPKKDIQQAIEIFEIQFPPERNKKYQQEKRRLPDGTVRQYGSEVMVKYNGEWFHQNTYNQMIKDGIVSK